MNSDESEPTEWFAFYSERAGREYYYNPNTRIVTWVLPDDDHPDGSGVAVGRREPLMSEVSRHLTNAARGGITVEPIVSDNKDDNTTTLRMERMQRCVWLLLFIILGLGICFATFWSIHLNSLERIQEETADMTESHAREIKPRQPSKNQSFTNTKSSTPSRTMMPPLPSSLQRKSLAEIATSFTAEREKQFLLDRSDSSSICSKLDISQERPPEPETAQQDEQQVKRAPRSCIIPLSYLIRRKCRQDPLFNAEKLADSMMQ